ncbi:ABC transporter ATP-binding protein/permease [Flavobacteriales bacterium]|nr:ABC transporter ATP-binding protein/permease [Flavobacteriales bacterium]MDB4196002.1 ABC transporter ATP-binding protein/permease [Flavobacteriales bacterium]MDB9702199.1 ABC transporter ATP-binding protein/permease [Flavobacteriales bacterium]
MFFFTVSGTIFNSFLAPIRPLILGYMIDKFIWEKAEYNKLSYYINEINSWIDPENGFLYWTVIAIITVFLEAILRFITVYFTNLIGQSIIADIREHLYQHIIKFKTQFFDRNPIGKLVTRLISDVEATSEIFSNGIITIAGDLLSLVIVVTIMFLTNWTFTLMVLLPLPILFWATNIFKNAIKKAYQLESTQVSNLNTFVQERIVGMTILQLFSREKVEYDKFTEINKLHRNAHIKSVWAYSIFFPVVEILSSISIAFVIFYASYQIIDKPITDVSTGELLVFILLINQLYRPIRMLADKFNVIQRGLVRAKNIFEVLDDKQVIKSVKDYTNEQFKGNIHFNDVSFAYNDVDYVLKDLSFEIKEGQTVAFVGATGAGKSSIINILSRFYEFQKGKITIDGNDLRDLSLENIRENIAVVLQDVFLFSDTIFNNITLNNPEITKEEVIKASKFVGLHDFIIRLPGGYDYDVKERGNSLSTGQRQLISFVRAYVYNPKILVLDEATSSIDTETEELIQDAIDKLTQGRTSIIVAHRLSTIKKADNIIVLDKGRIMEQGNHEELLAQNGIYRNLYEIQFED